MPFTLAQSLDPLVHPLGLVWLVLLVATLWNLGKRRRRAALFCGVLTAFISVVGSVSVSARILATLERPYTRNTLANATSADAVVMLGGILDPSPYEAFGLNLVDAGDRALVAAELMRQRKAETLVLGGGGAETNGRKVRESQLIENWLKTWGLVSSPVVALEACRNTLDEAVQVQILTRARNWKKVLLVTSAFHMRRAEAVFKHAGVPVVPVACDFQGLLFFSNNERFSPIPRQRGFQLLALYLHEKVGWYYYRWRGWLGSDRSATSVKAEGSK